MIELLGQFIFDSIIQSLNHIGAAIKWFFLRNKLSYKEILKQNWNNRIGILFIALVVIFIMYLTSYWS